MKVVNQVQPSPENIRAFVAGEEEELWDLVGLVEFPNPKTLLQIASTEPFREIEVHRVAGLAGQLNIAVRSVNLAE